MKSWMWSLAGVLFFLAGCSENLKTNSGRWSGEGPTPPRPPWLDTKVDSLQMGARQVLFQSQKVDGVEVEGTYFKELSTQKPEFTKYKWAPHFSMNLRAQILLMKSHRSTVEADFFKKHADYDQKDLIQPPELIVRNDGARWKFVFASEDGRLEGIYLDRTLNVVGKETLGSHFVSAAATLFPSGPLKSQLQKVLLHELVENGTLTSSKVKVTTQSDLTALAENSQFSYPVEDRRFEQVQAFFYLSQALDWCEKTTGFRLPFPLEAETSVGFPEKTNTAFYYQHRIRLGDGDDVAFTKIPLDPSIVMHESFHSVIEVVARLPYEGEGGSLNEAFADFFTTMALQNPNLGEASYRKAPFKRTVNNAVKLSERDGGLYHDSGIISGLLWSLQKSLGKDVGIHLAWDTLLRLTPDSDFEQFKIELQEVIGHLPSEQQNKAHLILQSREWLE